MSFQSYDQSSVQSMNRCTGPAPCHCSITGPHQPTNRACPRNHRDVLNRCEPCRWTGKLCDGACIAGVGGPEHG